MAEDKTVNLSCGILMLSVTINVRLISVLFFNIDAENVKLKALRLQKVGPFQHGRADISLRVAQYEEY